MLVNSVCTTAGSWEPKPFARKVCAREVRCSDSWQPHALPPCSPPVRGARSMLRIMKPGDMAMSASINTAACSRRPAQECARALGLLAAPACPMRAAAMQAPVLGRVVSYFKKHMQVGMPHARMRLRHGVLPCAHMVPQCRAANMMRACK